MLLVKHRTCAWAGLGEVGASELWQEGQCRMGTERGPEPALGCPGDGGDTSAVGGVGQALPWGKRLGSPFPIFP